MGDVEEVVDEEEEDLLVIPKLSPTPDAVGWRAVAPQLRRRAARWFDFPVRDRSGC